MSYESENMFIFTKCLLSSLQNSEWMVPNYFTVFVWIFSTGFCKKTKKNFVNQSDQKLLNDVTEYLIDNTKFNLPEKFLMKWMETAGENKLSKEDAEAEFKKSEKGLRYQLIESKIIENNKTVISRSGD